MAYGGTTAGLSRAEARRKREEYWRGVFAEQRASGLSHSEFCRQKTISMNAYFWWKRELPRREAGRREVRPARRHREGRKISITPSLIPVRIREPEEGTSAVSRSQAFEVVFRSGRVLRIPSGFHAEDLRRLISVLESETC